jgi:nicotinamidase-related amidase
MQAAKYVLLVIDLLNDYFRQHSRLAAQRGQLVTTANRLAAAFRRTRQPVLWVRQEFVPDLSDAFLRMRRENLHVTIAGTDGCELLPELDRHDSDQVLVKKRYSAFFRTDLDERLAAIRPKTLVLAGINTHACVRMTAIDAYQRDYEVLIASDGVASYDAEHHEVTKRYLDAGIARFVSSADIAQMLAGPTYGTC